MAQVNLGAQDSIDKHFYLPPVLVSVGDGTFRSVNPDTVFSVPPGEHMVTMVIRVTNNDVCPPAA